MVNQKYQQQKQAQLEYSKKRVKKAGDMIRKGCSEQERAEAIEVIRNFRQSHLYPLMLIKNHVNRMARKVCDDFILARRLKRLPTILDKLERPTLDGQSDNAISLIRMQDIGGCRLIFDSLEQLYDCLERLKASRSVHKIVKQQDTLFEPKASGYRGVHLVFSCYENSNETNNPWYKHKIELQLRTRLQHAWATCVETIDIFEHTQLKTRIEQQRFEQPDYRQFFKLTADLMANEEQQGFLTEHQKVKTLQQFFHAEDVLEIENKLSSYSLATKEIGYRQAKELTGQLLIWLANDEAGNATVFQQYYSQNRNEVAIERYNQLEDDTHVSLVVLVAVKTIADVQRAYPNYYADTSRFVAFIKQQRQQVINAFFDMQLNTP